jgi:lysine 6-dehydrogenase
VKEVRLADLHTGHLPQFLAPYSGERLIFTPLDVRDKEAVLALMRESDAVMSAIPYYFNYELAALAVEAGVHFSDLGGNTEIVLQQRQLDAKAKAKGVSVIPDCGLAPGMVNILAAEGIRRLDKADRVKIFVGGLPQKPEPPLNYQIVYSLEGALDYYTTPSLVLRGGKKLEVDALSELEDVIFPTPIGTLEAFHTAGGISTLPMTWEGKIDVMEYKTLRYPGHVAIIRPIRELGLLDNQPIAVRGQMVVPRDAFIAAVTPKLLKPEGQDLVALRVEVSGIKDGKPKKTAWQLIDKYDETTGITAMMRTTGYSLAITALMQADGRVTAKGVVTPDESMPAKGYIDELAKRGVKIEEVA